MHMYTYKYIVCICICIYVYIDIYNIYTCIHIIILEGSRGPAGNLCMHVCMYTDIHTHTYIQLTTYESSCKTASLSAATAP